MGRDGDAHSWHGRNPGTDMEGVAAFCAQAAEDGHVRPRVGQRASSVGAASKLGKLAKTEQRLATCTTRTRPLQRDRR